MRRRLPWDVERNQKAHSHVFRLGSKLSRFKLSNFLPSERCSLVHKPLYVWRSLKKNAAAAVAQFWALQIIFCNYNAHHTYLPTYLVKHESTFYHRDHIQTEIALREIKRRPAGPDPMKHFQCNFILRSFLRTLTGWTFSAANQIAWNQRRIILCFKLSLWVRALLGTVVNKSEKIHALDFSN